MANVNANINITVNSQQATAQLRTLQAQVNSVSKAMASAGGAAAAQQVALTRALMDSAQASGRFSTSIVPVASSLDNFTRSLEKNKLTLGQYTRFAASQMPGLGRVFRSEMDMMTQVAEDRVKRLNTQFLALGNSANGAAKALAMTPTQLDAYSSRTAVAQQRQMLFNKMIDDGSTKLLNWGKNTQWAGRQLMVGFSIPLGMMGAAAAQAFMEIDKSSIAFRRVYGDLQTTTAEMERNLQAVKDLGREYTKYGITLADTIDTASRVAATGATNQELMAGTKETLRLATLGQMEYNLALEATTALQTAFGISSQELGTTIDFLNAVENQTVLTLQDISAAIPRVAPVVKGLGGDVKDLAVFMTAMKEGGISAEQGANALKSGLASLINPTDRAQETMSKLGINMNAIIQANKGDLMGTVKAFGNALDSLGEFERQQALEQVFGKYQYARLGALFKNINNDAGQAARTLELAGTSMEDLADLSEKELQKIQEATSTKFKAALEELKISIAPVGEAFLKALTPIIEFATKVLDKFNELPDGVKNAIAIIVGGLAGLGPIVLMTVGLIGNGIANIVKGIQAMRKVFARVKGDASAFDYLASAELEAAAASASLEGKVTSLTGSLQMQQKSVSTLIGLYERLAASASSAAAAMPTMMGGGARGGRGGRPAGQLKMANGGVVPGSGSGDKVPALLEPGEMVVTKKASQKYGPVIAAMNAGTLPGFQEGLPNGRQSGRMVQFQSPYAQVAGHLTGAIEANVKEELAKVEANRKAYSKTYIDELKRLDAAGAQTVRTYTNLVALMSGTLNEAMKNGTATISQVKQEIGNTASQVELKRQLQTLGLQDDEIDRRLQLYVKNLNAQLDLAEQKMGSGAIASKEMDRLLRRASVSAAGKTFTDPRERAMFARMATESTTFTPSGTGGRGRRQIASPAAAKQDPSLRSYVNLRGSYGIAAATKFNVADIEKAGYSVQQLQQAFAKMPEAAQRAIIATKGNFDKAVTIFRDAGTNAGQAYSGGLVTAIASSPKTVRQAVAANRQAASPAPWAAPMGSEDGGAYAKGFTGAVSTGMTKEQYRASQSAQRRESYNIRRMQESGMTDTQTLRQLRRLEESKARAQKQQLVEAQRMSAAAQQNAQTMGATARELSRTQKFLARGGAAAGRVSEWWNAPAGKDGSQTRGGRVGSAVGGASAALSGLAIAGSFAGGAIGEMSQKILPATLAISGLQMIGLKAGLALAPIVAMGAIIVKTRTDLDGLAKSAAQAGANVGGMANSLKIIEEATGFRAPRQEDKLFRFTEEDKKAMSEFGSFFESESGQKFISELKDASSEERYQRVSYMLAQAVASGLEEEKAKAFGQSIAEQLGDSLLNSSIARDFANNVFGEGSKALLDLERNRLSKQPQIGQLQGAVAATGSKLPGGMIASGLGASPQTSIFASMAGAAAIGGAAGAVVGTPFGGVGAVPGYAIGAFIGALAGLGAGFAATRAEQERLNVATEESAKAMGFALQTAQNLANAEAILEQERENGLISIDEYNRRYKELNDMQQQQADYIGQIIALNPDEGALRGAMADQLKLQGFADDAISIITENFNAQSLAQRFFKKDFGELAPEQQQYVQRVMQETLTGITPENAAQRLQDLEGTWTQIANDVVGAMMNGAGNVDIDQAFNQANFESWLTSGPLADSLNTPSFSYNPQALAGNLASMDQELKAVESSATAVQVALNGFTDPDLAVSILANKDNIKELGTLLSGLEDFTGINIENAFKYMQKEGLTAQQTVSGITSAIEGISNIKLDKKIFGNTKLDAQELTESLMNSGVALEDIPKRVADGVSKATKIISGLGKKDLNKLGNIKISANLVTTMFGKDVKNPQGVAALLQNAYPKQLPKSVIPIMLSLMNPEMLQALSGISPQMANFMRQNPNASSYTVAAGTSFAQSTAITPGMRQALSTFDLVKDMAGADVPAAQPTPQDTSGGGGGKTDPLKELQDSIKERLALYGNIEKFARDVKKKKDSVAKALQNMTFSGSVVDGLRKAGISEMMIAEILQKGAGFAKKMLDSIKKTKELDQQLLASVRVEQVGTLRGQARTDIQRGQAAQKLRGVEGISQEQMQEILSDDAVVQVLASLKKGTKGWNEYMNALRASAKAADDAKKSLDPVGYAIEQIDKKREPLLAQFEAQDAQFQQAFGNIDRAYAGRLTASRDAIKKFEEDIAAVQKDIDALQRLNEADQRSIRTKEREKELKQREIQEKERSNELDQRAINSLQRQSEIISRQIEQYERQNQERQRQIDLLNRQAEMLSRELEKIERANELDQRRIDTLSREDEIRSRVSDALNYELDLMSQQEQKIQDSYNKRFEALDKIADINQRIVDQQKQQLDLSRAISEGDIYAATQAAQQMRASSAEASVQQTRAGMQQGMENQIAGLRTSGGLTREQANAQMQGIQQQQYQTQLAIRDIEDQIYQRNLEAIPLRDQQLAIQTQIRDIEDAIYQTNLLTLPLKDQQTVLSDQIRQYEDAIYQRNLEMIPLKDYITTKDKEIRDLQDQIYSRESSILDIQVNRLQPLQDSLAKEQESLGNLEKQMEAEKAAVKIGGITYAQLQERIDKEKEAYNVAVSQMRLVEKTTGKVGELVDQWNAVAKAIASANRTAQDGLRTANDQAKAARSVEAGKLAMEISAAKSEAAVKAAQARYNAALAGIDADLAAKKAEIEKTQADAIAAAYSVGNTATKNVAKFKGGLIKGFAKGGKMKYPTGGFVLGEGSRDSVNARLTPGEYVIRKSMVDKYGIAMMDALNLGSFALPRYDTGDPQVEIAPTITKEKTINAPVYNTYDMNFNISGSNLNADDVANKVMMKIKQVQSSGIRGNRGY